MNREGATRSVEPAERGWRDGRFFSREGHTVRCTLCPHACSLDDHQVGACGTRRRRGTLIETASYSATVKNLDWIEKKPLYHFHPGTLVLTIGAPGCSFSCLYCQNYRLSQSGKRSPLPARMMTIDPAALVDEARSHAAAIGFSYSEPSLAAELTMDVAAIAKPAGVPVVWKTNGFMTRNTLDTIAPSLTAVNVDVKAATEECHRRLTGAPLRPVLEALSFFAQAGVWVEVSTPVIPGVNADRASLEWIAAAIAEINPDIPWHLGRFNPDFRMVASRPTLPTELEMAASIGSRAGLNYVYVERAMGECRDTRCPGCGLIVVKRGIWHTRSVALQAGACPACRRHISGRW